MRYIQHLILTLLLITLASCASVPRGPAKPGAWRYTVVQSLAETTTSDTLQFSTDSEFGGISVIDIWPGVPSMNGAAIKHNDPNGLRILMAYQLEEGKAPRDYQDYRLLLDRNLLTCEGTRWATLFTERTAQWPYDIVDDMTFPTAEALECFLTPTETMRLIAPDLFADQFFLGAVEVNEQALLTLGAISIDGERVYYSDSNRGFQ